MRRFRVFNDRWCRAVVYPVGVGRAPGSWSSVRRQQQQQLNQADAEEVAVNAAPHLSGVAAPRRPAPLPGERRALVGLSRQEGETGGGPEVESHAWTRVLLSHRGLYFFIPEWTPPVQLQ
ncbi:unnamed protein product [Pleuronectes platessa]|uniref:Uncharacterized protein n=1 Tax=Pleuronectes platessa TaxID=8262 RepID=A0A9N7Z0R6_PLEPL|nr:unnamed protein product [Pleuronectes platessa]